MDSRKFYVIFCLLGMMSCKHDKPESYSGIGLVPEDSTMIRLDNYSEKIIHLGSRITNDPLSSQIVVIDGKEKYLMLDESFIYLFDWDSGMVEDSISIASCGHLYGFSGFTYINQDSIYVYNYNRRELSLIDMSGTVKESKKIPSPSATTHEYISSVEALNGCRICKLGNNLILSGRYLGSSLSEEKRIIPVAESVETSSNIIRTLAYYPTQYHNENWGSNYMNSVYTVSGPKEAFLISFPILPIVYKFSSDFEECDTLIMRSRYDTGIQPCEMKPEKMYEDKTNEIRYYISQPTYSNILYDPHRQLYLRVAQHKLDSWDGKSAFIKPFSIIVADSNGIALSESSILKDSSPFMLYNMHICKDGLAIATRNEDEDNLYFTCFKINMQ